MGSIKVSVIAVVATLTPLSALALDLDSGSDPTPAPQEVQCTGVGASVTVSVPNSTVNFVCQLTYTFYPVVNKGEMKPNVCRDASCRALELLTDYCPNATLEVFETAKPEASEPEGELEAVGAGEEEVKKPAATLRVPKLPAEKRAVFYVQCKPPADENTAGGQTAEGRTGKAPCVVTVSVDQAANTGVRICRHPSITVDVADENSSVQFSCEKSFNLYPTDPARVFKNDCKTEEPLKDMTRTALAADAAPARAGAGIPSAAAAAPPVYTLKAVKKPPKKKLCYLCAKQDPDDKTAKPPGSYCAIYVESSARAPFGLGFTPLALVLSFVLAMLRLP